MKIKLFVLLYFCIAVSFIFAGDKPEHDAWFEQIIIGGPLKDENKSSRDGKKLYHLQVPEFITNLKQIAPKEYEKLKLLEDALTIAIDQYNEHHSGLYESLKKGLKNPEVTPAFEKIDFKTKSWWNHEKPTHLGWDKWRKNAVFNTRKKLLMGVVKEVFPTADKRTQNELCRFFCAIHVLGDIFGNIAPKRKNDMGKDTGSQQACDTRMNIEEFVNELRICLPVILDDSEDILLDLEIINNQARSILGSIPLKKVEEEKYFSYIRLAGYKESSYSYGVVRYKSVTEENCETIQNLLYTKFSKLISEMDYFKDSFPELCRLIKGSFGNTEEDLDEIYLPDSA